MVYEKTPRETCERCGKPQFVKKNQVHVLPRATGQLAMVFLCKYCGSSQPLAGNQVRGGGEVIGVE